MSIPGSPNLLLMRQVSAPAGPFQLSTSCRLNPSDSAYLHRTPSTTSSRQVWTWSGWFKRSQVASTSTNQQKLFSCKDTDIYIEGDKMCFGNSGANNLVTSQVFKDYSSWYHLVVLVDTSSGIANDRQRMFLNGKEITAFSTRSNLGQAASTDVNLGSNVHRIGANKNTTHFFGGYFSDMQLIDGMALYPSCWGQFSSTTGDWNPKQFAIPAINDGRTWSSNTSNLTNAANAFNGTLTNQASNSSTVTLTFNPALTDVASFEHYTANSSAHLLGFNGATASNDGGGAGWRKPAQDIPLTINNVQITHVSGSSIELSAVRVNGQILIDGTTDRTTKINSGTTWSSAITYGGSSTKGGHDVTKSFDGDLSSRIRTNASDNNGLITFTPATAISYTKSVRAYNGSGSATMYSATWSLNGGSATAISAEGWVVIATGTGTLTSLSATRNGDGEYFSAIEVDGQILMDGANSLYGTNGFKLWSGYFSASSVSDIGKDYSGETNNYTPVNLAYSAGSVYSLTTSGNGFHSSYPAKNAFDGNISTIAGHSANSSSNELHFVPPSQITGVTKLRIRKDYVANQVEIRIKADSTWGSWFDTPASSNADWVDITSEVSGNKVNGIDLRMKSVSNSIYIAAIEINDVILVNSAQGDLFTDSPDSYGADTATGAGGDVRGNFSCLNPLDKNSNITLANGNLSFTHAGSNGYWYIVRGTMSMPAGKWYFEITAGDQDTILGIATGQHPIADDDWVGESSYGYGYSGQSGNKRTNGSNDSYGNTFTAGDVIGVAFDADNGKLWFSKGGTWQNSGNPATGANPAFTGISQDNWMPAISVRDNSTGSINCGQHAFNTTAPSGYTALCTTHLSTPTVAKPTDQFKAIQYPGSNSAQTIAGLDFQPNFVWIKGVDKDQGHNLQNTERGSGKGLQCNSSNAEFSSSNMVSDFNSDGFDLGTDAQVNESGKTYVSWSWNVPTDFSNSAGSNGASLASTGQVNTTAGISVVVYTGTSAAATVYHGMTREPYMIFTKPLESASGASGNDWRCYHRNAADSNPWEKYVILNSSGSINTWLDWNNTQPTSSVFSVGGMNTTWTTCENSIDYIAYCFAPVAGYSAMGLYTGTSGEPFVQTGFRPAFFLLKRRDNSASWYIFDNARNPYNELTSALRPNSNVTEQAYNVSFLSNGVLIETSSDGDINGAGAGYMWYAVAESPFKTARAR